MIAITVDERDLRGVLKQIDQMRAQNPKFSKTDPIYIWCKSLNYQTGEALAFEMVANPNHRITIEQLAVR